MSQETPDPNNQPQATLRLADFDPAEAERVKLRQEMIDMAEEAGLTLDQATALVDKLLAKKQIDGFDPEEIAARFKFAKAMLNDLGPSLREGLLDWSYPQIADDVEELGMEQLRYLRDVEWGRVRRKRKHEADHAKALRDMEDEAK